MLRHRRCRRARAAAFLVSRLADGLLAWTLAPFVAASVYLAVESTEAALAEKVLRTAGVPDADEVTP